jgi:uncharacterized protein YkwD
MKRTVWLTLLFALAIAACTENLSQIDHTSPNPSDVEMETHRMVNEYREGRGLPPLTWSNAIADEARQHSRNMADGVVELGHAGFDLRADRLMLELGLTGVAENVAYNYGHADPLDVAVQGWIESDGHRANMEGDYEIAGMGIVTDESGRYYFTQIFGAQ